MPFRWRPLWPFLLLVHALCASTAFAAAGDCGGQDRGDALHSLLESDRQVAQAASVHGGAPAAFLAALSPDSELFLPALRSARWYWQLPQAGARRPNWSPQRAGHSADGALGYTLGPYWSSSDPRAIPRGRYLAIWLRESVRQPWQLQLDHGVPGMTMPPAARVERCLPGDPGAATAEPRERLRRFEALRQAEQRLATAPLAPSALQIGGSGAGPRCAGPLERMRMAGSADLAYTAGASGDDSFVRVWRYAPAMAGWQLEVESCGRAAEEDG